MKNSDIETYLAAMGDLLASQSLEVGIVLVGGAALLLQDLRSRTTTDIDIIAAVRLPPPATELISPAALPPAFQIAADKVARDFQLPSDWINSQISAQLTTGLPPGFADRIGWRRLGGLWVGLASRRDLIFLKLYAAADQGPGSRHTQDILAMNPKEEELASAAAWVRTQDVSQPFSSMVDQVVAHVRSHPQ